MSNENTPEAADRRFFAALTGADADALRDALSDDFVLVDVFSGSEVPKSALVDLIGGGALRFESVEQVESRVRVYGDVAVIRGRTRMAGAYEGSAWSVNSRYTHVFVSSGGEWRLVAAQGTQIAEP